MYSALYKVKFNQCNQPQAKTGSNAMTRVNMKTCR